MASRRVVLTFENWDVAARPHGISAATVKQYGRRLVLDIGKPYNSAEDDAWIRAQLNYTVKIEEDILVKVEAKDYSDIWMDDLEHQYLFDALHGVVLEDPPTPEGLEPMDWPDYTSTTPIWDMVTTAVVEDAGSSVTSSQVLGPVPWNLADGEPYGLQVESLWRKTNSTPDVVVAVVDSGIAQKAKSAFLNLLDGYDFISDTATAADGDGRDPDATDFGPTDASCPTPGWHGTKVASVLAAKHTSGVYGVAQNCSVLPIRVLGLCSEGYANDITDAIVWAIGGNINGVPKNPRPAKIISLSLAGTGACPSYLQSAINQANTAGVIVVAAAGNEGLPSINNTFPANCQYVVSVGARARDGSVASFSNKGATTLAPGINIPVLLPSNEIVTGSGTSFAVPHLAGLNAMNNTGNVISPRQSGNNSTVKLIIPELLLDSTVQNGSKTSFVVPPLPSLNATIYTVNITYLNQINQVIRPTTCTGGCLACPAGKFARNTDTVCSDCLPGSYSAIAGHPGVPLEWIDNFWGATWVWAGGDGGYGWPMYLSGGTCMFCYAGVWRVGSSCATWWHNAASGCSYDVLFGMMTTNNRDRYMCYQCKQGTYLSAAGNDGSHPMSFVDNIWGNLWTYAWTGWPSDYHVWTTPGQCLFCYGGAWRVGGNCNSWYWNGAVGCNLETLKTMMNTNYMDKYQCIYCNFNTNTLSIGSSSNEMCLANAGYYGAGSATECGLGYACSGSNTRQICSAGTFSSITTAASCSSCSAGYITSSNGLSACSPCPTGFIAASSGMTVCSICTAGSIAATNGLSVCTMCEPGTIAASTGLSSCTPCAPGSMANSSGMTACTICAAGTIAAIEGLPVCTVCAPGTIAATPGLSRCTPCAPGTIAINSGSSMCSTCLLETYNPVQSSSVCLGCTPACGVSQHAEVQCTASTNRVCCDSASVGTYKSNCYSEQPCPMLLNGVYVLSSQNSLNRCGDIQCNAGYYAPPSVLADVRAACGTAYRLGLLNYGLNDSCASYLSCGVCRPYTKCQSGYTLLRNLADNSPVLNSTTMDVQCTGCSSRCFDGTTLYSACTPNVSTVCAKCATQGNVQYGYDGRCFAMSDLPKGMHPFQMTFPAAYMAQFTTNAYPWPRMQLLNDNTLVELSWASGFTLNSFVPCNPPPEGYRFKAWSSLPVIKTGTFTGQSTVTVDCDPVMSMECIDYNVSTSKGWFKNASGLCQPCTRTSTYTTCTWGQFRDLSTCTKLQDSTCQPCRGTLPANGVWTVAKSPFFFDLTTASPCDWDCNAGYYKDAATQTCKACTNIPANANPDTGPFRIGNTLPSTICLNPQDQSTCKYFGGTEANGCQWVCRSGYKIQISYDFSSYSCVPCPTVTCLPGEQKYSNTQAGGCDACQTCSPVVPNAEYGAECSFTCNAGYYKSSSTMCSPCSVASCPANYYSGGCGGNSDSSCQLCSSCAIGTRVSTPCNATANTVCVPCTTTLVPNSAYSSTCAVVCNAGYVMVNGLCVACAASNADCPVGKRYNATCTPDNVGCSNCTAPATMNWCWTTGSVCAWDCIQYWRKSSGVCNYDVSKSWVVSCMSVPLTTPAPTTTTPAPTTTTTPAPTTTTPAPTTTTTAAQPATTTTVAQPSTSTAAPTTTTAAKPTTTAAQPTTTAAEEPVVVRETVTVSNVTLQQCACSANDLNGRLSAALGSATYIISCAQGDSVVLCENFTCPCNATARRRLLQQDPTTQINYVVKVAPSAPPPTPQAIQTAIRPVLAQATVLSVAERQPLPTQNITWDTTVLLFKRAAEDAGFATTGVVIGVVVAFIVIVAVVVAVAIQCNQAAPPIAKPTIAIKLAP